MRFAIAAVVALAGLLMLPTLIWGPAPIDSAVYNYVWTKQFGEALGQGVMYPRWLPGSFEGLGSPTFYFYPPIAFYISGLLQLAGLTTLQAIAGAATLALLASGLSMAAWLRFKGANPLWALLYMAAPYHMADWYQRAALAEFVSFAWLPLIALAIEAQPRRWATPLLAVSFAGLVMTHLPVALLTSLGLILPMVIARREHLKAYAVSGALGLGLSAIYLLPALTLQDHISTAVMFSPSYQPANWAPWGPSAALWVVPLALAPVALAIGRFRFWLGVTVFCAAMSLALLPFVWELPPLSHVQFPWRMLVVAEFAAITAAALSPRLSIVAVATAIALSAPAYARVINVAVNSLNEPLPAYVERDLPDAPEYLPAGSKFAGITAESRTPDLSEAARPTLGPKPVREAVIGGWISLLAGLLLAMTTATARLSRQRPARGWTLRS